MTNILLFIIILLIILVGYILIYNCIYGDSGKRFTNAVEKFYVQGEYERAIFACDLRLKKYPNEVIVIWHKACSLYHLNMLEEAYNNFNIIIKLQPEWEDKVNPYLRELKKKLGEKGQLI